ncbi:MAG: glycosyltransferase family 4 protein [Archaeoglobaceae archaeon]
MRVNFVVEDFGSMKYIGCSTMAKSLYENLKVEKRWNSLNSNSDLDHFHTFGPFSLFLNLKESRPSVLTAHSTPRANVGNVLLSEDFWRKVYSKIYNKFDNIIAVSETSKKELLDMGICRDIIVIHNGVDRNKFYFNEKAREKIRSKYELKEDELLVINVGQKTVRKGIFDFISMAKKHPDVKFMWVGGMPYSGFSHDYREIKRAVSQKYDNLIFPGYVEDLNAHYSAADLMVNPSSFETFGLTILEAMSVGLPVIMKDMEVFQELYSHSGMICKNVEEMDSCLEDLKDENYRKITEKRSLETAELFDIEKIAQQHVDLYRRLSDNAS